MTAAILLGATGAGDRLLREPHRQAWMVAGMLAIAVAGLTWTVMLGLTPRSPSLELRVSTDGVALADYRGAEHVRVPWPAVRAGARRLVVRSKSVSCTLPALEVRLGDRPVVIACWDERAAWSFEAARARPKWLAGYPQWLQLSAALEARGTLPR